MFGFSFITWLVIAFIFAALSSTIAEDKGHGEFVWGLVGFLLGPIGLLAAVGLSDRVQRNFLRQIAENFGEIKKKNETLTNCTIFIRVYSFSQCWYLYLSSF